MISISREQEGDSSTRITCSVLNPALEVIEYLAKRELGVTIKNSPDRPNHRLIYQDFFGQLLLNSILSRPEFSAMVHASRSRLRWMDLRPCGWDEDTKVRLLATSDLVAYFSLQEMSGLYNDLTASLPQGNHHSQLFIAYKQRCVELAVMALERRNHAEKLLGDRPMLNMEEGRKLLLTLSDQEIARVRPR